jgi:hypothetical protein
MSAGTPAASGRKPSRRPAPILAALLAAGLLTLATAGGDAATAQPATTTAPLSGSAGTASAPAFTQTKTIERTNLINGQVQVVDSRTVTLNVSTTTNLIGRQPITVSWSGAHPTGGIQEGTPDVTAAGIQEYPMVLLECHGTTASITPEDCWTSTPSERYIAAQSSYGNFAPWMLDEYAPPGSAQRTTDFNEPNPLPSGCTDSDTTSPQAWLPYVTPGGTTYLIGPGGNCGMPNEMSGLGGIGEVPSNETFAATNLGGAGSAQFDVWDTTIDPDLGCSDTVACALVAIPIMGISCDPAGSGLSDTDPAVALCENTGYWAPGAVNSSISPTAPGTNVDLAVQGSLWWAASNWRNRFVVPLAFAPPSNFCSISGTGNNSVDTYGSELLDQAELQWQPHFCQGSNPFTLEYAPIPEPEAATELQGGQIEAALVTDQPSGGFSQPVVHAPVAETGFAISFAIDNSAGLPVTSLNLDPRLLAKLLTESYPGLSDLESDPELLHACTGSNPIKAPGSTECTNPLDITLDPEFQALNPGVPKGVGATVAASVLLALSTQSDVMYALTSYINDDPAARAWLNGTPDPWGMVVNSTYKDIQLPVASWPLLSDWTPPSWTNGGSAEFSPCFQSSSTPPPALPFLAAPVPDLPDIAEDLQFADVQSEAICQANLNDPAASKMIALGAQGIGHRFMLAVTSLADSERYDLPTASLLTYTAPGTPAQFTSAAGMTFVAPTNDSLSSAASLLTPDAADGGWDFPYSLYQQDSTKAEQAYPGTMLVYADIPTQGLSAADAADYAAFLTFVAGPGQDPGNGVGQLPAGYLPMTAADNLGPEAAYTVSAAAAVAAQKGAIPALPGAATGSGGAGGSLGVSAGAGTGLAPSGVLSSPSSSKNNTGLASLNLPKIALRSHTTAKVALTPLESFGITAYLLLGMAGLAVLGGLAAAAVGGLPWFRANRGAPFAFLSTRLSWLREKKWV